MQAIVGYLVLILLLVITGRIILSGIRFFKAENKSLFLEYSTMLEKVIGGKLIQTRSGPFRIFQAKGIYKGRAVVCNFISSDYGPYSVFKMKLNKWPRQRMFMLDYPHITKRTRLKGDRVELNTAGLMYSKVKFNKEYTINVLEELNTAANIVENSLNSYA